MERLSIASVPVSDAAILTATSDVSGDSVTLEEVSQPLGRYGMVTRTTLGHVIVLDPGLPGDLRLHTLLHEVGHILLRHHDAGGPGAPDRLAALVTGQPVSDGISCAVPEFREWAEREREAEQFASTIIRRLRRGLTSRHLSRLDEAFG